MNPNVFVPARFWRLFRNDFLLHARKLGVATLALAGIAAIVYLTNMSSTGVNAQSIWLFPVVLLGGGLLFTSFIFSDMHDPLRGSHYLTLPCSNAERLLSRYLLSGPLLYLHAVVAYWLFEAPILWLCVALLDVRVERFDPGAEFIVQISLAYFGTHALMLLGALHFRSHALIKTALVSCLLYAGFWFVYFLAVHVVYWDYFPELFSLETNPQLNWYALDPWGDSFTFAHKLGALAVYGWLLFLSYLALRDHEVQDGL